MWTDCGNFVWRKCLRDDSLLQGCALENDTLEKEILVYCMPHQTFEPVIGLLFTQWILNYPFPGGAMGMFWKLMKFFYHTQPFALMQFHTSFNLIIESSNLNVEGIDRHHEKDVEQRKWTTYKSFLLFHRALFMRQKVSQHKKFRFSPFLYHKKWISSLYLGKCLQLSAVDIDKGY